MAAITPLPGNKCVGKFVDGTANTQFYCLKGDDAQGNPIFTCAKMRLFHAQCPVLNANGLCSTQSTGYVAAVTVCNQKLF